MINLGGECVGTHGARISLQLNEVLHFGGWKASMGYSVKLHEWTTDLTALRQYFLQGVQMFTRTSKGRNDIVDSTPFKKCTSFIHSLRPKDVFSDRGRTHRAYSCKSTQQSASPAPDLQIFSGQDLRQSNGEAVAVFENACSSFVPTLQLSEFSTSSRGASGGCRDSMARRPSLVTGTRTAKMMRACKRWRKPMLGGSLSAE